MASVKKGFVYKCTDFAKVQLVDAKWYYNWGGSRSFCDDPSLPFTPMKWGKGTVLHMTPEMNELLGFNEPDGDAQSNLTPQQALSMWGELTASGKRIGSPATAASPTKPNSWLSQFQALGGQFDFVCLHWYAPPNAASFLKWIDDVYAQYQKPIWVTEFAVADWFGKSPGGYPVDDVKAFMDLACRGMEARPFVERYTWKTRDVSDTKMGTSALFTADGTLTELGQLYKSI